jgi:hypothetical protein
VDRPDEGAVPTLAEVGFSSPGAQKIRNSELDATVLSLVIFAKHHALSDNRKLSANSLGSVSEKSSNFARHLVACSSASSE